MAKRRRLRKSGGGELEVNMQDVASDEAIPPRVAISDEAIFCHMLLEEMRELLSHMLLH